MLSSPNGNEVLAINEEKTLSTEMDMEDFLKCKKIHNIYVCPNTNLINRNLKRGCLPAIYSSDLDKAKMYCKVVAINASSEFVKQINDNSIAIYSQNPMLTTISCENQKDTTEIVKGFKIYTLNQTCSMITDNYFFRPSYKFQITSFIVKPLEFHVDKFISHIDENDIKAIMTEKSRLKEFNEIDITDIESEIEQQRLTSHKSFTWINSGILGAAAIVIAAIVIFLRYRVQFMRHYIKNRQSNPQSNPQTSV